MSFILDTLERVLGLSDAEKATVNAALPTLAKWVTLLNGQWDTLSDAVGWIAAGKPVALRLLSDGKTLGPIAQDVLSGGGSIFDAGTAMSAINDAKATISANPKLINALTTDYTKLAPLIAQIEGDLPKPEVQAFITLIKSKLQQNNTSVHQVLHTALGGRE